LYDLTYECTICFRFDFCFKYYGTRHLFHANHLFEVSEIGYVENLENESKSKESYNTDERCDGSDRDDNTRKFKFDLETDIEVGNQGVVEDGTSEDKEDSNIEEDG
jgi:hypothetical protein